MELLLYNLVLLGELEIERRFIAYSGSLRARTGTFLPRVLIEAPLGRPPLPERTRSHTAAAGDGWARRGPALHRKELPVATATCPQQKVLAGGGLLA
jgi:hypothetical protein